MRSIISSSLTICKNNRTSYSNFKEFSSVLQSNLYIVATEKFRLFSSVTAMSSYQGKRPPACILGTMTMGNKGFASSDCDDEVSKEMILKYLDTQRIVNEKYSGSITTENAEKKNEAELQPCRVELDTAILYGSGNTEKLLGRILKNDSKLKPHKPKISFALKANPFEKGRNLSKSSVNQQITESLKALNIDSCGVFYLHAPDKRYTLLETLTACDELFKKGKLKELGLSNYSAWEIVEAFAICEKHNLKVRPTVYQGMYNAVTREVEKELFPVLRRYNMRFYAYNPLAGGILTGKHKISDSEIEKMAASKKKPIDGADSYKAVNNPDAKTKSAEKKLPGRFVNNKNYVDRYWRADVFANLKRIEASLTEFNKHRSDANGKISLALASLLWLRNHSKLDGNLGDGVIVGASSTKHLVENLSAFSGDLADVALPDYVLEAFDHAWHSTPVAEIPSYSRGCHKRE